MKRKILVVVEILVFLSVLIGKPGYGEAFVPEPHGKPVDIYFNDLLVADWGDALPFIDSNGRTMIPLRFYAEKIGCSVKWEQKAKQITITYVTRDYEGNTVPSSTKIITLWVNNRKTAVYDSTTGTGTTKAIWLDTIPWQEPKYPWRVYVPLRFVSSCIGDEVNWFPKGSVLPLFPDITVKTDTVMLAHFLPLGPDDYQIVPGERYGKYLLNMSLEQFIKYLGRPDDDIYSGSIDGMPGKYIYTFHHTPFSKFTLSFVREIGIVGIISFPYSSSSSEWEKYYFNGKDYSRYYLGQWYDLNKFEADNPDWYYLRIGTFMRGGEDVETRRYCYSGFEVSLWADYQPKFRGYMLEFFYLWREGWDNFSFLEIEK